MGCSVGFFNGFFRDFILIPAMEGSTTAGYPRHPNPLRPYTHYYGPRGGDPFVIRYKHCKAWVLALELLPREPNTP